MSFRKRNIALSSSSDSASKPPQSGTKVQLPGVKPSSIDGRPVTSTGTPSLDGLLAGHGGLALGCSLLIEENGSTDYAGAMLKFYAAEGILQGHHIHVLGLPESWGRELPGVVAETDKSSKSTSASEKMKIAWRYESLGQFGSSTMASRESPRPPASTPVSNSEPSVRPPYNHTFDLTKRLAHPASTSMTFHPFSATSTPTSSPYNNLLTSLATALQVHPMTPHRLLIPSLLSPLFHPSNASSPQHLLAFLHQLRVLMSANTTTTPILTILTTLPLPLSSRTTGLTRWIELLHDGVIELSPFPHSADTLFSHATTKTSHASRTVTGTNEEPPQGLLRIHKLPILTDRGSGVRSAEDDWAFTLSRRRLAVKAWRLGPVDGDEGGGGGGGKDGQDDHVGQGAGSGKAGKEGTEF